MKRALPSPALLIIGAFIVLLLASLGTAWLLTHGQWTPHGPRSTGGITSTAASLSTASSTTSAANATTAATAAMQGTHACASTPSADTCNGHLPVTPSGQNVCFDQQSQYDTLPLTTTSGQSLGALNIWYLPACQSYTAQLVLSAPAQVSAQVIEHSGIVITDPLDGTRFEYFNPTQGVGPETAREVWSPLLWSPGGHVSACVQLSTNAGTQISDCTGMYIAGRLHPERN